MANTGTPTDAKSILDSEIYGFIRQQLVLLSHANECQTRDGQANGEMRQCTLPDCKTMQNVLDHLLNCQVEKNCTVPHCSMSRQIINHWNHCNRSNCPVCSPIKEANNNKTNSARASAIQPYDQLNPWPNPSPQTRLGQSIVFAAQQIVALNIFLPLNSEPSTVGVAGNQTVSTTKPTSTDTATAVDIQVIQNKLKELSAGPQLGPVAAMPAKVTKKWHLSVPPYLRNHFIYKLVQTIFPTTNPVIMLYKTWHELVACIRMMEGRMYEYANSQLEYYLLLTEIISDHFQMAIERAVKPQQKGGGMNINPMQAATSSFTDSTGTAGPIGTTNVADGQEDGAAAQQTQLSAPSSTQRQSGAPIGGLPGAQQATQGQMANTDLPLNSDPSIVRVAGDQTVSTTGPTATDVAAAVSIQVIPNGLEDLQLPGGLQPGQVTAIPMQETKEWHLFVSPDLRNHFVRKLVKEIFPIFDPQAMLDERMHRVVGVARKVEGDMYEMANSRMEYCDFLQSYNIYRIYKEVDEEWNHRRRIEVQLHLLQILHGTISAMIIQQYTRMQQNSASTANSVTIHIIQRQYSA